MRRSQRLRKPNLLFEESQSSAENNLSSSRVYQTHVSDSLSDASEEVISSSSSNNSSSGDKDFCSTRIGTGKQNKQKPINVSGIHESEGSQSEESSPLSLSPDRQVSYNRPNKFHQVEPTLSESQMFKSSKQVIQDSEDEYRQEDVEDTENNTLDSLGSSSRKSSVELISEKPANSQRVDLTSYRDKKEETDDESVVAVKGRKNRVVLDSSSSTSSDELSKQVDNSPPPTTSRLAAQQEEDEEDLVVIEDDDDDDDGQNVQQNKNPLSTNGNLVNQSFNNVKRYDDKPVAGWSPNYENKRLEEAKAKVKQSMMQKENLTKKIQEISVEEMASRNPYDDMKFDARVIRGPNVQTTNRNIGFESSLKVLREEMFHVFGSKPSMDENYEHLNSYKNMKVTLLPHQCYSMAWFKWREKNYPFGGILADDMGLGKTLTVLSYLNKVKLDQENRDQNEDEEDEDDEAPIKKGSKSKKIMSDDENDEDFEYANREYVKKKATSSKKLVSRDSGKKRLRTLIILPASLLLQWESEIKSKFTENTFKYFIYHGDARKRFAYNMSDYDIVFTTYEIVSREIELVEGKPNNSPLAKTKWKRVILDEAHRIKNHQTKANKTICMIKAKYRFALTGTPIHNSINDLFSLVKFLQFKPLDELTLWNYLFASEKFSNKTKAQSTNSAERAHRLDSWLVFLSDYLILRRTKNDKARDSDKKLVDLPEKNIEVIRIKLTNEEKSIYDKMFSDSQKTVKEFLASRQQRLIGIKSGSTNRLAEILVYLLRLRQACCHMSLLEECLDKEELKSMKVAIEASKSIEEKMDNLDIKDQDISIMSTTSSIDNIPTVQNIKADVNLTGLLKRSYLSSKVNKLLEMLDDILDNRPEDKVIIVSQWTSMLSIVARHLEKRDVEVCQISGDVSFEKRDEMIQEFNNKRNNDLRIMLLSLTAGGVGLNLVGANHMFMLDIHWNPALEQQCADRIYRVGQKKDVKIYRLICENTIETRIEQIQEYKVQLAQKVTGDKGNNLLSMKAGATNAKLTLNDFRLLFTEYENNQK